MTDTLDDVVKEETEMKNKVQTLTTQNNRIEENLKGMQKKIANIEASKNRFPYGWKYLGRGTYDTCDAAIVKQPLTFTECVNLCEKKRRDDGASWNGFSYYASGQSCYCHKNDRGHDMSYTKAVHFRFE